MAAYVEVVDAADLPASLPSRQPNVLWWRRNAQRDGQANGWGVRIVIPEDGRGYWPDFVVCVENRKKGDGVALAEAKERIETHDSQPKSRTEHREYGRALMLTYDPHHDRFERVEFQPALGRNQAVGLLRGSDLTDA